MNKTIPANGLPKQRGFTLIELLVVVVIISIGVSIVVLNASFSEPQDLLKKEARRLQQLLSFAQEQAIIRAEDYGLTFYEHSYKFLVLQDNRWQDLENDRHLYHRQLPENLQLELFIEQVEVVLAENAEQDNDYMNEATTEDQDTDDPNTLEENKIKPQVFILSSGEVTPEFSISLRIPGLDSSYDIAGQPNGQFILEDANTGF